MAIPATTTSDDMPFLMEAMAWYSHENIREYTFDLAFKGKGIRDDGGARMLDLIFNTLYLDFNSFMNFGGSRTAVETSICDSTPFVSAFTSVKSATETAMADFTAAWIGE